MDKSDDGHEDEEHHSLGLPHAAVVAAAGVKCVVDVQGQHLRGLDHAAVRLLQERTAAGKGQVLIKQLEAVGQGQEDADGEGAHHIGDGDLPQQLPAVGAVDAGGLQHILRNGLQSGDIMIII